jgi:tetratricopeptide (TPR) repeat protein
VMRLAILLGRAAFEGGHGNPAAPETFERIWALAHSAAPSVDFPLPLQWTQLGNLAMNGGRTRETLEAARHLQNWPRLRDAREYLEVRSAGLRLEAVAAMAGGEPQKSEEALRQWLEFCVSSFGLDAKETAEVQVELGHFLIDQGRASEAVPMLKQAATTRASSPVHPNVESGDAYFYLGLALDKSGEDTEAMTRYQAAYRFYSRALGPADTHAMRAAVHLAEVARVAHDYESAEFWFRHTLRMAGESEGNRTPNIALALNNLAETLVTVGRADEAAPLAEKGLEIRRELFGVESREYARSLGVVALIALTRSDRPRFDSAFHDFQSRSSDGHVSLPTEVAVGYLEMRGDYRQAIELCEGALRRLEDPGEPPDYSLMPGQRITMHLQLGRLHASLEQWADARRHMLEAFSIETVSLSDEAGRRSQRQMQQMLGESRSGSRPCSTCWLSIRSPARRMSKPLTMFFSNGKEWRRACWVCRS